MPITFYKIMNYQPLFGRDSDGMKDKQLKIQLNNHKLHSSQHLHIQALQMEIGNNAVTRTRNTYRLYKVNYTINAKYNNKPIHKTIQPAQKQMTIDMQHMELNPNKDTLISFYAYCILRYFMVYCCYLTLLYFVFFYCILYLLLFHCPKPL